MSNTAKRLAKAQAVLSAGNEPTLSVENYKSDLVKAMVWYNNHEDDKAKRSWLNGYLTKTGRKALVPHFNNASDFDIRQLGVLCRLKMREQFLDGQHEQWIEDKITELQARVFKVKKVVKKEVPDVAPATIQDRMDEKAHDLAGEIDGAIDDFATNGKTDFSVKSYLAANAVAAPIAKRIGDFYVKTSKELREAIAGDDPQLVEGYSNFSKRELKKFADFIDSIIADCNQMVQTAKATRAPRKRKEVTPAKAVSKMKVLKEVPELNLKSATLTSIIGSSEVWFYNAKYRRVGVYKGENGAPVSVKGTTIIGFDVKESKIWTLRKPEEFFKNLSLGKRALNTAVKKLTTKPATPNGRFNEDTLLLGAF